MKLIEKRYILSFGLVISLLALWGFANDITNFMLIVFQTVMELSLGKVSFIQFAFSSEPPMDNQHLDYQRT